MREKLFLLLARLELRWQALDPQITRKYMRVREDSMMDVFEAIGEVG